MDEPKPWDLAMLDIGESLSQPLEGPQTRLPDVEGTPARPVPPLPAFVQTPTVTLGIV